MKYRTRTEQYTTEHTIDGITKPVTMTREVSVPTLPLDWDVIGVRTAAGLVLTLTLVSVAWSTWSIGSLLHGGIGYAAATIFDVAWAVTLILEWLARFDPDKRTFPRRLGWALLLATMGAIYWHGMERHSVGLAVVGAAVSLFAKVLWLGIMRHVDRELSPEDAQWVAQVTSDAHARMAVASVRRQVARIEDRAAAELLALESSRRMPNEVQAPEVDRATEVQPEISEVPQVHTEALTAPVVQDLEAEEVPAPGELHPSTNVNNEPSGTVSDLRKLRPVQNNEGTIPNLTGRGTATEAIRELLSAGVREQGQVRAYLEKAGIAPPTPSYISRLIREAKTADSATSDEPGTGPYM